MRKVLETDINPEWVLSDTGHNTEWINTNIRLLLPRPNQSSASGSNAMAGNGLNIEVSVSSKSEPRRELMAMMVNRAASVSRPRRTMPTQNADKVAVKVGNNRGLSRIDV